MKYILTSGPDIMCLKKYCFYPKFDLLLYVSYNLLNEIDRMDFKKELSKNYMFYLFGNVSIIIIPFYLP